MAEDTTTTEEWKAQLSIRFGTGHMLNLRDKDLASLWAQAALLEEFGQNLADISTMVQAKAIDAIQKLFPESTVVDQAKSDARAEAKAQTKPTGGGDGRRCTHGQVMTYREGRSAKGPWKGYFCDVTDDPRLPKCAAQFLN